MELLFTGMSEIPSGKSSVWGMSISLRCLRMSPGTGGAEGNERRKTWRSHGAGREQPL